MARHRWLYTNTTQRFIDDQCFVTPTPALGFWPCGVSYQLEIVVHGGLQPGQRHGHVSRRSRAHCKYSIHHLHISWQTQDVYPPP